MKRFLWLFLILSTTALPLSKSGVYLLFKVKQSYIATYLCEKRQDPGAHCQGKCYLQKRLKKETQRETQLPGQDKRTTLDLLATVATVELQPVFLPALLVRCGFRYVLDFCTSPAPGIFHPPQLLA